MEQITIVYVNEECCNCGVIFGINSRLHRNLKETKRTFYCPNGHGQSYTKSTSEILREEMAVKERTIRDRDGYIATLEKELARSKKKPRKSK